MIPSIRSVLIAAGSLVYLDATRLSTFDFPNINRQIPAQVESIEYYAGGGQTPQRYATLNSECGVVVFHTRRPP